MFFMGFAFKNVGGLGPGGLFRGQLCFNQPYLCPERAGCHPDCVSGLLLRGGRKPTAETKNWYLEAAGPALRKDDWAGLELMMTNWAPWWGASSCLGASSPLLRTYWSRQQWHGPLVCSEVAWR